MTESNFRALCQELMDAIDSGIPSGRIKQSPLAVRVDAALAQPEPQGVSDEEIRLFVEKTRTDWIKAVTQKGLDPDDFDVVLARAALARWGSPAAQPVPVSDPPGPEDCDAEGLCWLHQPHPATPETPEWRLMPARYASTIYNTTHWLPHWALPVPGVEVE
jgi:hypothetical protein